MPIPVNLTPPPARPRGLLLDAAQRIPADAYEARNGSSRWALEGVTWNPWTFELADREASTCDTVYDKQPDALDAPVEQPAFLMWRSLQCSALSNMRGPMEDRVRYALEELESANFAAELESGSASSGLGLVGNATYTPEIVTTAADTLAPVFVALENYLATALHGAVGMIHLTPGLYSIAHALGLAVNGVSHNGHVVVGDAGHTGTPGPEGESDAVAGEAWIYATSTVWFDDTTLDPAEAYGPDGGDFDFTRNVDRPLAERYGIVLFDPEVLAAGLVDTEASALAVGDGVVGS